MGRKRVVIILDSDSEDDLADAFGSSVSSSSEVEIIEEFTGKAAKRARQRPVLATKVTRKRKRIIDSDSDSEGSFGRRRKKQKVISSTPPSAVKFQIPTINPQPTRSRTHSIQNSSDLWVDKYAPKKESELPIRKNRVVEVKDWLNNSLTNLPLGTSDTQRILILTGPTGVCKTTLIQVLCKELEAELCEWIDPSLCLWKDADG